MARSKTLLLATIAALSISACGKKTEPTTADIQETGQQVGDVMASIDESGGGGGSLAMMESSHRTYARLAPADIREPFLASLFMPKAQAAVCGVSTFSACSNNVITRNFNECTVGAAIFTGVVTLTFDDAAINDVCAMAAEGHSITRVPAFLITGRRGATLSVTKTGTVGQVITRGATAGSFSLTNDGIRRAFVNGAGTTLFDFTTSTTSAITVTGANRANRTLSGGTLRVVNNVTQVSCDFTPQNVTWTSGCNCATSGSFTGTCSDGKTSTLEITGCGAATLTVGTDQESFTFDRCYGTT